MRKCFIDTIIDCARKDDKIALLMAEVGFSVVEPFEKEFPNRFFNTGIAEQNLILTAAGMALEGMHPIAYSMASFLPSRAFEQIKVSVCYQNLPVVIVAVGSGLSYGEMGSTHHAIEESALMRSIPNLNVIFPSNTVELEGALRHALADNRPYYISYPKAATPEVPKHTYEFGRGIVYHEGKDGSILCFGYGVHEALKAHELLRANGLDVGVYGFHTVKPLDNALICQAAKSGRVYVMDEHNISAGIGGEVARILLQNNITVKYFQEFSIPDCFQNTVGRYGEMLEQYHLTAEQMTKDIMTSK